MKEGNTLEFTIVVSNSGSEVSFNDTKATNVSIDSLGLHFTYDSNSWDLSYLSTEKSYTLESTTARWYQLQSITKK